MQHDDCDHDHHPFDAFFLIAFTSAPWIDLAAAGEGVELDDSFPSRRKGFYFTPIGVPYIDEHHPLGDLHRAPVEIDGEALHPLAHLFGATRDPEIVAMHRANVPDLTWTPLFAHPPFDKPRSRLSPRAIDRLLRLEEPPSVGRPVVEAALALPDITTSPELQGYEKLLGYLHNPAQMGIPERFVNVPATPMHLRRGAADAAYEAFRKRLTGVFGELTPIVKLENIGPDGDTAYLVSPEGVAFAGMEANARTWGDHGELFELPSGWRFQDNMIQSSLGAPGDNLFVVITYDADNLPNPWEWQLHEVVDPNPGYDPEWVEVPTSPDKPRAGWAPSLLAAMTRARTAGSLHLDDRRAAAGGA